MRISKITVLKDFFFNFYYKVYINTPNNFIEITIYHFTVTAIYKVECIILQNMNVDMETDAWGNKWCQISFSLSDPALPNILLTSVVFPLPCGQCDASIFFVPGEEINESNRAIWLHGPRQHIKL